MIQLHAGAIFFCDFHSKKHQTFPCSPIVAISDEGTGHFMQSSSSRGWLLMHGDILMDSAFQGFNSQTRPFAVVARMEDIQCGRHHNFPHIPPGLWVLPKMVLIQWHWSFKIVSDYFHAVLIVLLTWGTSLGAKSKKKKNINREFPALTV